jgi:hypothetical protein
LYDATGHAMSGGVWGISVVRRGAVQASTLDGFDRLLEAPDVFVVLVEKLPLNDDCHTLRESESRTAFGTRQTGGA